MEDNETVDLQTIFERLALLSLNMYVVILEQNIKLKTKQYLRITLIL